MKLLTTLFVVAALAVPALADDDGIPVTLTGCLHHATQPGAYVLTNVAVTSDAALPSNAIYWLDDRDKLHGHAGWMIEITGEAERIETGEVEVEHHPKDGGRARSVEVEADGREAELLTTDAAHVPAGGHGVQPGEERKVVMPTYEVDIDEVKRLRACR